MLIYSANDSCAGLTMKILCNTDEVFTLVRYASKEKEFLSFVAI